MSQATILIVDDDAGIRNLLVKVLRREGYRADAAASAQAALDMLHAQVYDLMISDIRMPEIDGLALAAQVRQLDKQMPIILLTAFATVESAIAALRMGVHDYIMKPFDNHEVLAVIQKLLAITADDQSLPTTATGMGGYTVTQNAKMQQVIDMVQRVAASNASVLLYGETGTGKELAARGIHEASSRAAKPFVKVNCAALPGNLLEAELFGYERGAYTGAINSKPGRFEIADGGTILLDEIGELPVPLQSKLLRVLQERSFERLGGVKNISVDVRVIAATNRNLEQMVAQESFRQDLYYRLHVIAIELPPLRERPEDILALAQEFLAELQGDSRRVRTIAPAAAQLLQDYAWPGNIRELHNVIERGIVIAPGDTLEARDLPERFQRRPLAANQDRLSEAVDGAERDALIRALQATEGNRSMAAQLLGISRRSLHRKIARYGL